MSNPILASWLNGKYTDLSSLTTATVTKRTVTQYNKASYTDINNLVNDINALRSNTYLRHADNWATNTPATISSGEQISESLKNKIDALVNEFKEMCGNKQIGNSNTVTGNGKSTGNSLNTGFGRSTSSGNGQKVGNGVTTGGSFECKRVNHVNGCWTCGNNFINNRFSTFSQSTRRTSNSTSSFSTSSNSTRSNSKTSVYNFAVKTGGGVVENSNRA